MAKNLTNVHTKLDRILQRLSKLNEQTAAGFRRTDAQIRLMAQLVSEVSRMARDVSQQTADVGTLVAETLRTVKRSDERIAELLASARQH
jgi:methyl-accepting chemotaxis protein